VLLVVLVVNAWIRDAQSRGAVRTPTWWKRRPCRSKEDFMTDHDPQAGSGLDREEAGRILSVVPEQITVMVAEGMLRPLPTSDREQFARAEVQALRVQGG
jgi:hypothetical protein